MKYVYADELNVIVTAYTGEIWISHDNGLSFDKKPKMNEYFHGITVIDDKIYVGGTGNIFTSTNDGDSFETIPLLDENNADVYVKTVTFDESSIILSTDQGLYISTDHGTSFVRKTISESLERNSLYHTLLFDKIIYTASSGGLSISSDGSATFSTKTIDDGLGSNTVFKIAISQ